MKCIGRTAVAHYLCIDSGASFPGMLQLLQDDNTRALSHNEAASLLVKGNGTSGRILTGTEGCERRKTGNADRGNAAFRASRHHHVRIPVLDGTECFPDAVGSRRTGCNHIDALALQAELDGYVSSRHIADHHGHQKGIHTVRPFLQQLAVLALHRLEGADAGADSHAHAPGILLLHIQSRIRNRFLGCRHRKLAESLHSFGRLKIHIILGVKILHFRRQLTFIFRCIEFRNRCKACFS